MDRRPSPWCRAAIAGLLCGPSPAWAQPAAAPAPVEPVCAVVEQASAKYHLPTGFFTRLIWRESSFRIDATSPAGAQGIAQFMPSTAASRGLTDPFARDAALDHSAAYLDELRIAFGNLGLAAAAYNAGPGRVSKWLAGEAALPQETIDYVLAVTRHEADDWKRPPSPVIDPEPDFTCARFVASLKTSEPTGPASGVPAKPWAVILVGSLKREAVLAEYANLRTSLAKILGGVTPSIVHRRIAGMRMARYIAQIETDSRAGAEGFCDRLKRAGGSCFVLANHP